MRLTMGQSRIRPPRIGLARSAWGCDGDAADSPLRYSAPLACARATVIMLAPEPAARRGWHGRELAKRPASLLKGNFSGGWYSVSTMLVPGPSPRRTDARNGPQCNELPRAA